MINPFEAWSQMFVAGVEMQSTWLRSMETVHASNTVICARAGKMRDAAETPAHADLAEFARMVPEKVDAFGRSASSIARDTMAMYGAWTAHIQRVGAIMITGRPPTMAAASVFADQTTQYALQVVSASAKLGKNALVPIHHAATSNARRLGRPKAT